MSTMSEEYIREAKEDYDRIVRSVLFGPDGCKIYIENDYMCEGAHLAILKMKPAPSTKN